MNNTLYCLDFEHETVFRCPPREFCTYAQECLSWREVKKLAAARTRFELSQGKTPPQAQLAAVAYYCARSDWAERVHLGLAVTADPYDAVLQALAFSPAFGQKVRDYVARDLADDPATVRSLPGTAPTHGAWAESRAGREAMRRGHYDPRRDSPHTPGLGKAPVCNFETGELTWCSPLDYGLTCAAEADRIGCGEKFWDRADQLERSGSLGTIDLPELLYATGFELLNPLTAEKPVMPHHGLAPLNGSEGLVLAQMLATPAARQLETEIKREWSRLCLWRGETAPTPQMGLAQAQNFLLQPYEKAAVFWHRLEHPQDVSFAVPCVRFHPRTGECRSQPTATPAPHDDCLFFSARELASHPKIVAAKLLAAAYADSYGCAERATNFLLTDATFAALGTPQQRRRFVERLVEHPAFVDTVRHERALRRKQTQERQEKTQEPGVSR